jgi:hypothetical protein
MYDNDKDDNIDIHICGSETGSVSIIFWHDKENDKDTVMIRVKDDD